MHVLSIVALLRCTRFSIVSDIPEIRVDVFCFFLLKYSLMRDEEKKLCTICIITSAFSSCPLSFRFKQGRDWVANSLNLNVPVAVSFFESTIRVLGGLLAVYELSGDKYGVGW